MSRVTELTEMITSGKTAMAITTYTAAQGIYNLHTHEGWMQLLGLVSLVIGIGVGVITIWVKIRQDRREQETHDRSWAKRIKGK